MLCTSGTPTLNSAQREVFVSRRRNGLDRESRASGRQSWSKLPGNRLDSCRAKSHNSRYLACRSRRTSTDRTHKLGVSPTFYKFGSLPVVILCWLTGTFLLWHRQICFENGRTFM